MQTVRIEKKKTVWKWIDVILETVLFYSETAEEINYKDLWFRVAVVLSNRISSGALKRSTSVFVYSCINSCYKYWQCTNIFQHLMIATHRFTRSSQHQILDVSIVTLQYKLPFPLLPRSCDLHSEGTQVCLIIPHWNHSRIHITLGGGGGGYAFLMSGLTAKVGF
jgi:hypothetical protein